MTLSLQARSHQEPFFEGFYGRHREVGSKGIVVDVGPTGSIVRGDHELAFVGLRLDYRRNRGIVGVSERWVERGNLLLVGTFPVDRLEGREHHDGVDGWLCRCILVLGRLVFLGGRHSMVRNGGPGRKDERGRVRDGQG